MKKQNQLFNTITATLIILTILFFCLGCVKVFTTSSRESVETNVPVPVTPVDLPVVEDKKEMWYFSTQRNSTEYYIISSDDTSLKGQLANCVEIIYKSFGIDLNSDNFKNDLFGDMDETYVGPTQLINSLTEYNRVNQIMNIQVDSLINNSSINYLQQIVNNNYPIIVWYSSITLDEKTHFDGYAYWDYAKPLIIYAIDDQIHVIDPEKGYQAIDKDEFEHTWQKCGNHAVVIG